MKKILLLIIIGTILHCSITAQNYNNKIPTKKELSETIYWLRDNPLNSSDPVFQNKYVEVLNWVVHNKPDFKFNYKGLKEFMNMYEDNTDYPYTDAITLLYSVGLVDYEINTAKVDDFEESSYYSIKYVLTYYDNLIKTDKTLKNELLESYKVMEKNGELEKHIKKML